MFKDVLCDVDDSNYTEDIMCGSICAQFVLCMQ